MMRLLPFVMRMLMTPRGAARLARPAARRDNRDISVIASRIMIAMLFLLGETCSLESLEAGTLGATSAPRMALDAQLTTRW
jgi:hypothetical protein